MIYCTVPERLKCHYMDRQLTVVGTLHVRVDRDAQRIQSLYTLDVESITSLASQESP